MTKGLNRWGVEMLTKSHKLWTKISAGILVVFVLLFLSGCSLIGGSTSNTGGDSPKISLLTGETGIDDPYYKDAWEGLQKADKQNKMGIEYVKNKSDKDYPAKLADLAKAKREVIITIGSGAIPAVLEAAEKNPKIKYICLDAAPVDSIPANVLTVSYKVEEASFLAGYLAGKTTKSNVVGFISGDNKEKSEAYYYGFKAGLRKANSTCELMKGIAGTFANTNRLEEMTERMVEAKADIVFHVAGSAGKGMIKVMDKYGKYAIGADVDQNNLAPQSVITSVLKNNGLVINELLQDYQDKKLSFGQNLTYGLAEKGVGLAESTESMISDATYQSILQYEEKITSGQEKIPSTENEYLSFTEN